MRIVQRSSVLLFALLLSVGSVTAAGKNPKPAKPVQKPEASSAKQIESTPQPAVVRKPTVDVHVGPDFATPTVATLKRDTAVSVTGQQGLWFKLALPEGKAGFVRVNDVRLAYATKETGGAARALFTGKAGKGRVSETAGVRGLDESELKAATYDAVQLAKLESYRVTPQVAAKAAGSNGWSSSKIAYATEFKPKQAAGGAQASQGEKRGMFGAARGLLSVLGSTTTNSSPP